MRRVSCSLLALVLALALAACSDDDINKDSGTGDGPAVDAGVDVRVDTGPPPCGTGNRPLPKGLTELKWDSGKASTNVRAQTWAITVDGKTYQLAKEALLEAVRFDLEHPAEVYGFAVQWTNLDSKAAGTNKLSAGLFRDFGHNGFDLWEAEPLWSGTRCQEDVKKDAWTTYVFKKPVVVDHPGLVYVGHRADKVTDPVFSFDDKQAPNGKCAKFATCHSSINLPNAGKMPTNGIYYNGTTIRNTYNFMVRLYIKYTKDLKATDRIFLKSASLKASKSSVSWGDFDNDGWDDLLVGGTLYKNDKGTFTDVTTSSGITDMKASATGGVWGDYDNDGCLDLFLFSESMTRADTLARGDCKGKFTDVTAAAKITDKQSYNTCGDATKNIRSPSAAAAWIDIDGDGYLDIYMANFICWTPGTFYMDTVFRNKGDGTFEEWSTKKGFSNLETPSRTASPVDHDGDGDVDIFVGNYRLIKNLFFQNNGDGTVTESAATVGLTGNARFYSKYYYGHTIGSAWGDLDNDGDFDLVVGNLAHPRFWQFSDRTQLLINDGKGSYKDISGEWKKPYGNPSGLRYQETHSVPALGDFDNDGILDLAITCVYEGRPTDFYWGKGDGKFTLDSYTTGITTTDGWGISASDYDHDGDLDIYATGLYVNTPKATGRHWFQVRAVGNLKSNWAAIGATVKIKAGAKTYMRHVQGGTGKGCQDSLYLHFGLGAATSVDEISVAYPGGKSVKYAGPFKADQRVWVYEDGKTVKGWAPTK